MGDGRILVAMPCYNTATTLISAIEAVFNQTYKNYLLVCCDDGSTDNTYRVLVDNQSRLGYEVMKNESNVGTGETVNNILNEYGEKGFEFMTWVSADNLLLPKFLSIHVDKLNEGNAISYCGWCSFNSNNVNRSYATMRPIGDLLQLKKSFFLGPGFMFRKKLWDRVKPFEGLPGEDYYFAVKCALAGAKFGFIDEVLVRYRRHRHSVTGRLKSGEIKGSCSGIAMDMAQTINFVNGENSYL